MKKYKILIFDLDDTLIDNRENIRAAFTKILAAAGETYSNKKFERWYKIDAAFWAKWRDRQVKIPSEFAHEVGKKSEEFRDWVFSQRILQYFGNEVSNNRAVEFSKIYTHALTDNVLEIDGAHETLKYLAEEGAYRVIVGTNGPKAAAHGKLEKIGVLPFVSDILSAETTGCMKPYVEFFEAIKERHDGFQHADYLMIGDSLKSDVGFAQNVGIDSCWFDRGEEKLTSGYAPTFIIKDLRELRAILQ
jgi:HAD superfamily hydrolase (TIGR01549 family)